MECCEKDATDSVELLMLGVDFVASLALSQASIGAAGPESLLMEVDCGSEPSAVIHNLRARIRLEPAAPIGHPPACVTYGDRRKHGPPERQRQVRHQAQCAEGKPKNLFFHVSILARIQFEEASSRFGDAISANPPSSTFLLFQFRPPFVETIDSFACFVELQRSAVQPRAIAHD